MIHPSWESLLGGKQNLPREENTMRFSNHLILWAFCLLLSASCVKRLEPRTLSQDFEQQTPSPPTGELKESPIFLAYELAPKVIYDVDLEYPKAALEDSLEGSVVLNVIIDESGKVLSAEVVRSSPPEIFNEAAIAAVMQWKYKPAIQRGVPIRVQIAQLVLFRLKKRFSD